MASDLPSAAIAELGRQPDLSRPSPRSESAVPSRLRPTAIQRVLSALWVGLLPAFLAVVMLRFFVPAGGAGFAGFVAGLGQRHALISGIALYFLFSALARYWRFSIPGGRYASALPASVATAERDGDQLALWARRVALYRWLASPSTDRRLSRTLGADPYGRVARGLSELRGALETGDNERAQQATSELAPWVQPALASRRRHEALLTLALVVCAAGVALGLRGSAAQVYQVIGSSMQPTLQSDDQIAGLKLAYAGAGRPRRGDIIVFRSSTVAFSAEGVSVPDIFVKRVVGLPGDRITMNAGEPLINGWAVPSCDVGEYVSFLPEAGAPMHGRLRVEFLDGRAYLTFQARMTPEFPHTYTVKPGEVFVLGDSRGNSIDSRAWNGGLGGGVPIGGILARADWFLVGTHRNGAARFDDFGRTLDRLQTQLRYEGIDTSSLEKRLAKCLREPPKDTRPPPPPVASN